MQHFFDLDAHEAQRLAAVLDATGDLYDPSEVEARESLAWELLLSDLSPEQQAMYDELVAAGVL
jgi:hypothetical protein